MQHHRSARYLKIVIFVLGIWGIVFYAWGVPLLLQCTAETIPSPLSHGLYLACALPTAAPCFAALVLAYTVAARIGRNRSFCIENARAVTQIAGLLAIDAVYVMIINLILQVCGKNSSILLAVSTLLAVFAAAAAAAFWVLSKLLYGASHLETENRLTI